MTTFNSHRAFYKNAKQAFYETAGKVMMITTLAALLVITPSVATAQMEPVGKIVCLDAESRENDYWWIRNVAEKIVCLDENREMLWDETSEVIWDFTDKDVLFDENGEMLWDFTDAVEKIVQGEVGHAVVITSDNDNVGRWVHTTKCEHLFGHDYDFDGAVQDEHGNWWVECQDCGYWGLWIDGEVI